MPNQEEGGAKKEETLSWRKCPVCAQEFQDFLPLIKHLEEHRRRESQRVKIELGADDYLQKAIMREFFPGTETDKNMLRPPGGAAKRKFAADAKGLLVVVADWLQEALMTIPEINTLLTSDLKVADQLVGFVSRLLDNFREQRDYLLKYQECLKETGMDRQPDPICGGIDGRSRVGSDPIHLTGIYPRAKAGKERHSGAGPTLVGAIVRRVWKEG